MIANFCCVKCTFGKLQYIQTLNSTIDVLEARWFVLAQHVVVQVVQKFHECLICYSWQMCWIMLGLHHHHYTTTAKINHYSWRMINLTDRANLVKHHQFLFLKENSQIYLNQHLRNTILFFLNFSCYILNSFSFSYCISIDSASQWPREMKLLWTKHLNFLNYFQRF